MKNFVQPGRTLTVPAPSPGVASGDPVLIGSIFGVANGAAVTGADVEIDTVGVFTLPKATGASWAVGDPLYWDATAKNVTKTAGDNLVIGAATAVAAGGDTVGNVKIGPLGATVGDGITVAAAIADAVAAAANPPTKIEFDALVTKFNSVLAALRANNVIAG
jgi:predicted RecA/RadA family phage recombinase